MTFQAPATPMTSRSAVGALAVDLAVVGVFAAVGRRSHTEGVTAAGVASTAWPFAVGALTGWAAGRGWRAPTSVLATGVPVWAGAVVGGMLLRRVTGGGTATSFVVVATVTLGVLGVGWRVVARLLPR